MAQNNKEYAARLRRWFASNFNVDPNKINIEKAFKYMNYLNSPEQQAERFLDRLDAERREFEQKEADRLQRTLVTRYVE